MAKTCQDHFLSLLDLISPLFLEYWMLMVPYLTLWCTQTGHSPVCCVIHNKTASQQLLRWRESVVQCHHMKAVAARMVALHAADLMRPHGPVELQSCPPPRLSVRLAGVVLACSRTASLTGWACYSPAELHPCYQHL